VLCFSIILLFIIGIDRIPFHPDETSLLYQSRDLEKLFTEPSSLVWVSERTGELDQSYRLLNPPLPKYIIGIGRILSGYSSESVGVDWDWSASWEENVNSSALPDPELLLGSRLAITAVLAFSMFPLGLIAKRLSGRGLVIVTLLIFGLHSLVLLHGRRAMSEGPLIFGISLAILGILEAEKRPWLAGIGTAIAASSKLSAVALFPVALFSIVWRKKDDDPGGKMRLRGVLFFSIAAVLVTLMLNPVLWSNPLAGVGRIWNSRLDFVERQTQTLRAVSPNQILETPSERIGSMLIMLFFRKPQTSEVANYVEQTNPEEAAYLGNSMNTFISGIVGGSVALLLTVSGIGLSLNQLRRAEWRKQREIILLIIGTFAQAVSILMANSIPFQRYYIPLVPFIILWMGLGISGLYDALKKAARSQSGSS
jgi:4-amino-4-deoxy-L-arabinose transferase-like glycosyltransferase